MIELKFKQLSFEDETDNTSCIKVNFLNLYYFYLYKSELSKIGEFAVKERTISFNAPEQRAKRKLDFLIDIGLQNIKNKLTKRNTFYIHRYSGIPLLGCLYFGIVDKGSGMIELKPLTGCNMNCTFCSVDEGLSSKRRNDYLIEKDYLVQETSKLLNYKKEDIDIYINPHGEPLLYPEIAELCEELSNLRHVKSISIITAGTLLSKPLIDRLASTKKTKLNISLHAIDEGTAKKLFGAKAYNLKHVMDMLRYASKKINIDIAPVLLPGYNEPEIIKIINFAKEINAKILLQKYLHNKMGRNPVKEESWGSFYSKLRLAEKETNTSLINDLKAVKATKELPSPFKPNEVVKAKMALPGRFRGEMIAIAKERIISVSNCIKPIGKEARVKILKTKYGLFRGKLIK